jgi:DNA invertase Pin-like site-specific DNA recombinase
VAELSDGSSASRYATKGRDEWAELLRLVPELDVVVFWEPSRGDRTLSSWVAFLDLCRDHEVLVHATGHGTTYDPRKARDYRGLAEDGVDAAYESDKISMRTSRGMANAAASGLPAGPTTYGYVRVYHDRTGAFVEQVEHPEHAGVVREIVRRLGAGEAVTAVASDLTGRGVPTPEGAGVFVAELVRRHRRGDTIAELAASLVHRGILLDGDAKSVVAEVLDRAAGVVVDKEPMHMIAADLADRGLWQTLAAWQTTTLQRIAINPAYIGVRVHRAKRADRREFEAAWPAIISREEHDRVVRAVTSPQRRRTWAARPGRATSLVGNIALCGHCGKRVASKGGGEYRCCVRVNAAPLDELVTEAVIAWSSDPEMFRQLRQASDQDDRELVAARAEMDRLTTSLDTWRLSAARGATTPESLAVIEADITAQLKGARRRVEKASTPPVVRDLLGGGGQVPEQADVRARWASATLGARRDLVRTLMTITIHPCAGRGRKLTERVEITWR